MLTHRILFCRCLASLALVSLAPAPWAHGQRNRAAREAAAAEREDFVLRTYEVGDLVVNVPDYASAAGASAMPAGVGGGGFGGGYSGGERRFGGGGGFFSVPDDGRPTETSPSTGRSPAIILAQFGGGQFAGQGGSQIGGSSRGSDPLQIDFDSLIDAMTSVVAPDTWQENGTGKGDVRVVGAALAVWQTPDVHERIEDFLNQLRQGSARRRTVTIDARWLLLNSDDLDRLNPTDDEGQPAVDRRMLAEFTRRATSLRGLTNCFSGQAVYLISGTRRNVVSGYIPVVGSIERPESDIMLANSSGNARLTFIQDPAGSFTGRGVGYQPLIATPNFGVQLQVRPTMMLNENAAVVDLTSTITFPGENTPVVGGAAAAPKLAPDVDRVAIDTQELATTLRVPLGKPTLVGGMSYISPASDAASEAGAASPEDGQAQETPQLYLVLEIR